MNPGKIISDDPHVTLRNFRPPAVPSSNFVELQLKWNPEELVQEAARCNGCGTCKTQSAETRMCPFFRTDLLEEAGPRSKANVMRNFACGTLDARDMTSATMKRLTSPCFNCKQCELDCPSNVDIPHLMIEANSAYGAANCLSRADWILSRASSFGALGSTSSMASNWVINSPMARWFLERFLGIARQRKLPQFSRRPFLRTATRRFLKLPNADPSARPIVYFVGDYANYYDTELARAFVAILKHNGIPIIVPRGQTASGMAMVSAGDLDAARDMAEKNIRELAEYAREGYSIVCTEPSAALCLKQEYPMLVDHPDVELVASRVLEAGAYLQQLAQEGKLRSDFQPLNLSVGYHTPCHLKALSEQSPLQQLMTLIPGLSVHTIEEGCSGMAGAYGLTRENFRSSLRIGWGLISQMRSGEFDIGATECSSCKFQMEQGTTTPTLHPLKLMALSYGLMPEIRNKLERNSKKLVVT